MNHKDLQEGLKKLMLRRIAQDYVEIARACEQDGSTFEQYLAKLVTIEIESKRLNRVDRLLKQAELPRGKLIDTYNYAKRKGVTKERINRLASGNFLHDGANVVFYGDFGVGKSHLAEGLTRALCEQGYRCWYTTLQALINDLLEAQKNLTLTSRFKKLDRIDLITVDELGYSSHTKEGSELFFQLISQRYERKSMMITTNLTYSEWDQIFPNPFNAKAAVDRIIHRCETFNIAGPSWRAEEAKKRMEEQPQETKPSEMNTTDEKEK